MSDKPIDIGLTSDSRDFVKAVNEGTEALDDLQKGLDDAAKEGDKSAEKLEKSFDETIKTVRDLGDASESAMRRTKRATDGASDGMSEFKDESISTAKEAAASFDGSAESILDAFQEVAANAFQGFGSSGIAAGIAAAAGLGVVIRIFDEMNTANEETKQKVSDLANSYIETGQDGAAGIQRIIDRLKELATSTEDGNKNLEGIATSARLIGQEFFDVAKGYAGSSESLDEYIQKLRDERQAIQDSATATGIGARNKSNALGVVIGDLEQVQRNVEDAQEAERRWVEMGGPALQAKADAVGQINDAYDEVVNSVTDYLNAETGVLDVEAYLNAIEQRRQALVDYQKNLGEANLTDEQKTALNAMGQEAASIWLDAYTSPTTTDDQKRRMASSLTVAASDASGVAMTELDKEFSKGVQTKLKIDTSDAIAKASADLRSWTPDEKALRLRLDIVDRYGQPIP